MKRLTMLVLLLALIASPAYAGGIRWRTNRLNPALICDVNSGGFSYGNCSNDVAGRGFINIALWRGNGECDNPTLGGQSWHPEATKILSIQRTSTSLHVIVAAPNYIPIGGTSQFCGSGYTEGQAFGAGGDIIEMIVNFGDPITIDWIVTPAVDAACMQVEVTSYNSITLDTPLVWAGDHYAVAAYDIHEDLREGLNTGAPIGFHSSVIPGAQITLTGEGVHYYSLFSYPRYSVVKLSAIYEFCDVHAGNAYSGHSAIQLGE